MSSSPELLDEADDPGEPDVTLGILFLCLALALWEVPWICLWLMPEDGIRWLYLLGGNCCGAAMLAALWITSGSGKWWLRILQGVALLTAAVGGSYLAHRHLIPLKVAGEIPTLAHAITQTQLIVCLVGLLLRPAMRGGAFRIGPASEPEGAEAISRITLAEMFQVVALVAVALSIVVSLEFATPPQYGKELFESLVCLLLPAAYVLLQAAYHAGLPALRMRLAGLALLGIVLALVVALPFLAKSSGASPLLLCIFAGSYLLVYLTLSALREWGLFIAIPPAPYQRTRFLSGFRAQMRRDESDDAL